MNKLLLGDNLEILRNLESESVDLIYLDPPFFSNRNYEVIWGDKGEVRSFEDRWAGGINHYIDWLKERVIEMHRILKSTGSLFLHCDWHANAYIRVDILDKVFGYNNFRNEIIWKRKTGTNSSVHSPKQFGQDTDSIYFYSKSDKWVFNAQFNLNADGYNDYIEKSFKYVDEKGRRYQADNLANPAFRPNLVYEYKGYQPPKNGWAISKEKMEQWDKEGRLHFPESKSGRIRRKRFLDELKGKPIQSFWDDISNIQSKTEKIGYPTQKPEALLERIIKCASNEGDIVLDPFVGGGTTIAAADKLNRKWIGIDQSVQAIKVSEMRLQKNQTDIFATPFIVQLHKYDYDTLRYKDAFEFESFIIQQFGGTANTKQRGDLGIDGKTRDNIPIQVKRSDNIGREVVDKFQSACRRYSGVQSRDFALQGIIIAFSFGKGAFEEVARLKSQDEILIKLLRVDEIVPIAKKPSLTLSFNDLGLNEKQLREIEFIAQGESEAGIEFYAWDFHYDVEKGFKAEIMLDKIGKQTQLFKTGSYQIAVKVVDNEGLENSEILSLKINGVISIKT